MACKAITVLPRRCWAGGSEKGCALVLQQFEGGVENLTRVGVTLALHLLHPLVPDRLARELGPARKLVGRNGIAVELVVSGFGSLDHALLGGVEEIPAPELCSRQTADAHDRVAHVLGQRLPLLLIGGAKEVRVYARRIIPNLVGLSSSLASPIKALGRRQGGRWRGLKGRGDPASPESLTGARLFGARSSPELGGAAQGVVDSDLPAWAGGGARLDPTACRITIRVATKIEHLYWVD